LPSFNSATYTGSITAGSYAGSLSDAYTVTYGNYAFGSGGAPTVTPATGGALTFVTPLQANTTTNAAGCTNDPSINPLVGANAGVWIIVTDT
jgi:hypothetical protein